jgi:hypothetical protein
VYFNSSTGDFKPGDRVHGRVEAIGRDAGTTYLKNTRTGKEYKYKFVNQTALLGSTNAEWVTECQTGYDQDDGFYGTYTANFTAWQFENAKYLTSGTYRCVVREILTSLVPPENTLDTDDFFARRQKVTPGRPGPTNRHRHQWYPSRKGCLSWSRPPRGPGYLALQLHSQGLISLERLARAANVKIGSEATSSLHQYIV